ncbi:MAG: hypothetical protein QM765_25180 [Myxococcales bacterium]
MPLPWKAVSPALDIAPPMSSRPNQGMKTLERSPSRQAQPARTRWKLVQKLMP